MKVYLNSIEAELSFGIQIYPVQYYLASTMSEYKFSNIFQIIMFFQHFLQIFEMKATTPKRHSKFF